MDDGAPESHPAIRIDLGGGLLTVGGEAAELRPKTWAVLRLLASRPGALVTKNELLDAVWPDTIVTEGTLNKSIGELRDALGDDRLAPRFIETVPRRGFRWIGGQSLVQGDAGQADAVAAAPGAPASEGVPWQSGFLVGRDAEVAVLERAWARALGGVRQVVFVGGEAGAGKSTLVDAFLARLADSGALVSHGQCIEAFGEHEPYRPVFEGLERLARRPDTGTVVVEALSAHAPTWLRQMPFLAEPAVAAGPPPETTPGRMLREIAVALEELSRDRPVVVVLEDAHWADLATMDALNLLARRRDPARLLVLVTLRPADALVAGHPVVEARTELTSRALAVELSLAAFPPSAVSSYLEERCSGLDLADDGLSWWIHHQTAGNPLFVRIVVDELVERGMLAPRGEGAWELRGDPLALREFVPDSMRELVERQTARLNDTERAVVEAAAILRGDFAPAMVAAVADLPEETAEEACAGLARRGQVLRRAVRAGGGAASRTGRFAFVHSTVQRILRDRLAPGRLRRLHLAAARRLEQERPENAAATAVQLSLHYAMAGEPAAALQHLQQAADSVRSVPAPREVVVIRERILDLIERNPGLPGHRRERIAAMMSLADARQLAWGAVDAGTTALCERVLAAATEPEDVAERFRATLGLFWGRYYGGRYEEAVAIGERLLAEAEAADLALMVQVMQFSLGSVSYRLGRFEVAEGYFEQSRRHGGDPMRQFGWNYQSMSLTTLALIAVHRGRPAEARALIREAEVLAARPGATPDASVVPLHAFALVMMHDDAGASVLVERSLALVDRSESAAWIERARFLQGLFLVRGGRVAEGVRAMKDVLLRLERQSIQLEYSAYCCLLAGEMMREGVPGASHFVEEGIAYRERSGEAHYESELYRLRGELRLAAVPREAGAEAVAEADFRRAVEAARQRGARWNELQAATGLARLLHRGGRDDKARALLEQVTSGFDPGDEADLDELRVAREMLAVLDAEAAG